MDLDEKSESKKKKSVEEEAVAGGGASTSESTMIAVTTDLLLNLKGKSKNKKTLAEDVAKTKAAAGDRSAFGVGFTLRSLWSKFDGGEEEGV